MDDGVQAVEIEVNSMIGTAINKREAQIVLDVGLEKEHFKIEIKEIKGTELVLILNLYEQREEIHIPYRPIEEILAIE